jgi:hypothetical protein
MTQRSATATLMSSVSTLNRTLNLDPGPRKVPGVDSGVHGRAGAPGAGTLSP